MTRHRAIPIFIGILAATLAAQAAYPEEGSKKAAPPPPGTRTEDLSGIWEVRLNGKLVGSSLLCQAVPPLNLSWRDTVSSARNLEELVDALVPDSSRVWFDRACRPRYKGNTVAASCRIPMTYAQPCVLVADIEFNGVMRDHDHVSGTGGGDVSLAGTGVCPQASCPSEITLVAHRVGPVPRADVEHPGASR